ncbi:MAG: hypothetical protein LBP19_03460 [Treponema sp.]|nr:hypothetical protein [Treponema sp.]
MRNIRETLESKEPRFGTNRRGVRKTARAPPSAERDDAEIQGGLSGCYLYNTVYRRLWGGGGDRVMRIGRGTARKYGAYVFLYNGYAASMIYNHETEIAYTT